jgi:putative membrane protein
MQAVIDSLLTGLPYLVLHLTVTLAMLAVGAWLYEKITPIREVELIKAGNTAAAISYSGALLGLAVPLAACMAVSINVLDIVVWGVVALLLQLAVVRLVEALLGGLWHRIEANEIGAAILVSAVKLSVAVINAAAVSG